MLTVGRRGMEITEVKGRGSSDDRIQSKHVVYKEHIQLPELIHKVLMTVAKNARVNLY